MTLNLAIRDGLDVIHHHMDVNGKERFFSVKNWVLRRQARFSVLEKMWSGFCAIVGVWKCSAVETLGHSLLIPTNAYITFSLIVLVIMLFCEPVENKCFLS